MRYAIIALIIASPLLASCSSDDGPIGPTQPAGEPTELDEAYVYNYNGAPQVLTTSPRHIAIRFRSDISGEMEDGVLARFGASREAEFSQFGVIVAVTDDAFALAPKLSVDARVRYVGPVFETECGGMMLPTNEFTVRGDLSSDDVQQLLEEAGATMERTRPDDPEWFLMSIPWGDARDLYDLTVRLARRSGVVYADPSHVQRRCPR